MQVELWIAMISHRHGTNTYAALSEVQIWRDVRDYVQREWDGEITSEEAPAMEMPDRDAVARYFELVGHEGLDGPDNQFVEVPQLTVVQERLARAVRTIRGFNKGEWTSTEEGWNAVANSLAVGLGKLNELKGGKHGRVHVRSC